MKNQQGVSEKCTKHHEMLTRQADVILEMFFSLQNNVKNEKHKPKWPILGLWPVAKRHSLEYNNRNETSKSIARKING